MPPLRYAALGPIATHLPSSTVDDDDLAAHFSPASIAKLAHKTGVHRRHVVSEGETASDLAVAAAERLFAEHGVDRAGIDQLLLVTQSPDFAMPATSCLVQDRLGLSTSVGALDVGQGCSGWVSGLGLATALVEAGQAENVLLLTADTLSRYVHRDDRQLRVLFGDGAAATLVHAGASSPRLRGFSYGTDGSGARHLIVPAGGLADPVRTAPEATAEARGLPSNGRDMHMAGAEVFTFTLRVVPRVVEESLARAGTTLDEIDLVVLHQANAFMLETLRLKLGVPAEKFVVELAETGNTTSSSIPFALEATRADGRARPGARVLVVGFGVGLSWAAAVVDL